MIPALWSGSTPLGRCGAFAKNKILWERLCERASPAKGSEVVRAGLARERVALATRQGGGTFQQGEVPGRAAQDTPRVRPCRLAFGRSWPNTVLDGPTRSRRSFEDSKLLP